jgi:hypothetical protein
LRPLGAALVPASHRRIVRLKAPCKIEHAAIDGAVLRQLKCELMKHVDEDLRETRVVVLTNFPQAAYADIIVRGRMRDRVYTEQRTTLRLDCDVEKAESQTNVRVKRGLRVMNSFFFFLHCRLPKLAFITSSSQRALRAVYFLF